MTDPPSKDKKDFVTGVDSNARKSPRRVVFVTRRTSAQVKAVDEDQVQTFPEVLFRALVAIEVLSILLVWIALLFNAPLEGVADPSHTPNPAKAPWYFLGLQEMLHYFPPVVAGVLVPTLVIIALIVIPYFNINIEAEGLFLKDRQSRLRIFYAVAIAMSLSLTYFHVYVALVLSRLCSACPNADCDRLHAAGRTKFTPVGFALSSLSRCPAALLLDHDLVLIRTGGAYRRRHVLPWPRVVLGMALEELSAIAPRQIVLPMAQVIW